LTSTARARSASASGVLASTRAAIWRSTGEGRAPLPRAPAGRRREAISWHGARSVPQQPRPAWAASCIRSPCREAR
jgi:hypothetical protein